MAATDGDDALAVLLAQGLTYEAAGRACRMSATTVGRRMATATFRAKVSTQRALIVERLTGQLLGLADDAVSALRSVLADPHAHEPTKVRAALAVLALTATMPRSSEQISQDAATARRTGELSDLLDGLS